MRDGNDDDRQQARGFHEQHGRIFTYHATPVTGATFECKLDAGAFASCDSSGISYSGPLAEGSHTFQVQALNASGTGPAASYTWTVDLTPPTVTIDTKPPNPAPGTSSSFTFHSSENGSTFQCSLALGADPDSFSACSSGKTYTNLANGDYTFKVRATDSAGNQGSPASYGWTVDNSLVDTTPPETTIDSQPLDPSSSSSASFTYESNEPGSAFQCKLDGAAFASCPATGVAYAGLSNATHTFQVRAIDPSGNVDLTPAGYTFSVVLALVVSPAPVSTTGATEPPVAKKRHRHRCRHHRSRRRCHRRGPRNSHMARRSALIVFAMTMAFAAPAAPASATFHLMQIREVYPASAANPGSEYVELQMYAAGQNLVAGHSIVAYNAAGAVVGTDTFGADAANGADQSTIVIATPEAEAQFQINSDGAGSLSPSGQLDPTGGAVCWAGSIDCMAWGAFSGSVGSAGPPANPAGIPDGMALRRTIAPGCATLLEGTDDTNNSAADFSDAFPAPRPNSASPPSIPAPLPRDPVGREAAAAPRHKPGSSASLPRSRTTEPRPSASGRARAADLPVQARPQAVPRLLLVVHASQTLLRQARGSRCAPRRLGASTLPPPYDLQGGQEAQRT